MKNIIKYLKSDETKHRIVSLINENILLYKGIDTEAKIQQYSGLVYNQFVQECVQNNQYISLSNKTINEINDIYKQLVLQLKEFSTSKLNIEVLTSIVENHRSNLIAVIENNEYEDDTNQLFIPCAEYTGEFQNEILKADVNSLIEPIIDIGCGISCELVKLLRRNGYVDVYGIDQYISSDTKIICSNWFDYIFQEESWGTLIAHMSFSNHLRRSVINKDENKERFIEKYNEILRAIKKGGVFIYTPSVKPVEDLLDRQKYKVEYFRNHTDRNLDTVYVTKLL